MLRGRGLGAGVSLSWHGKPQLNNSFNNGEHWCLLSAMAALRERQMEDRPQGINLGYPRCSYFPYHLGSPRIADKRGPYSCLPFLSRVHSLWSLPLSQNKVCHSGTDKAVLREKASKKHALSSMRRAGRRGSCCRFGICYSTRT